MRPGNGAARRGWWGLEKEVALMDDVAVLEADLGEGTADLGAQFDALDGRELAEELEAAGDVTLRRGADGDARQCGGRGRGGRRGQQLRPGDDTARDQAQGDQGNAPGLEAGLRGMLAADCSSKAMSKYVRHVALANSSIWSSKATFVY